MSAPFFVERVVIWASLGFLAVCGVLLVVTLQQVREVRTTLAHTETEINAIKARVATVETDDERIRVEARNVAEARSAAESSRKQPPLALAEADVKIIRQFIKVPRVRPETPQSIQVGDKISISATAPLPDSLVEQVQKLRGARFLLDNDGSIVIVARGSGRADAVIGRQ